MVKNFVPSCDLCGEEIPFGNHMRRNVPADGVEVLMIALENSDPELEFIRNDDGTVDLDTCRDCYTRIAFRHSVLVN
jgi:hypothetical protein